MFFVLFFVFLFCFDFYFVLLCFCFFAAFHRNDQATTYKYKGAEVDEKCMIILMFHPVSFGLGTVPVESLECDLSENIYFYVCQIVIIKSLNV